ncbi:MAG: AAA family ATPase [Pseudomonadota bacterium]
MYLDHFNLVRRPFAIAPDPEFLIWTDQHEIVRKALLEHALSGRSVTLLAGEVGCGKTALLKFLIDEPEVKRRCKTALISIRVGSGNELLQHLVSSLCDASPLASEEAAMARIMDELAQGQASGVSHLIILDEAQAFEVDAAKHLALLISQASDRSLPLSVIIAGQPELAALMNQSDMAPLNDIISTRLKLGPLSKADMSGFVQGRLEVAGWSGAELFDKSAINAIHRYSGGVPRLINKACELSLFTAAKQNLQTIDASLVAEALDYFSPLGGKSVGPVPASRGRARKVPARSILRPDQKNAQHAAPLRARYRRNQEEKQRDPAIPDRQTSPANGDQTLGQRESETIRALPKASPEAARAAPVNTKGRRGVIVFSRWAALLALVALPLGLWYMRAEPDLVSFASWLSKEAETPRASGPDTGVSDVAWTAIQQSDAATDDDAAEDQHLLDLQTKTRHSEPRLPELQEENPTFARTVEPDDLPSVSDLSGSDVRQLAPVTDTNDDPVAYYRTALQSADPKEVAVNYTLAALRGHARSATYLGQLFETGDGLPFDPEIAQRWYQVAQDSTRMHSPALAAQDVDAAQQVVTPMASVLSDKFADFVWNGRAREFTLELASANKEPVAYARTSLTAIRVEVPTNAVMWRVKTDSGLSSVWQPLETSLD